MCVLPPKPRSPASSLSVLPPPLLPLARLSAPLHRRGRACVLRAARGWSSAWPERGSGSTEGRSTSRTPRASPSPAARSPPTQPMCVLPKPRCPAPLRSPRAAALVQRPLPDRSHGAALCRAARRCTTRATPNTAIPTRRRPRRSGRRPAERASGRVPMLGAGAVVCLSTGRVCVRVPSPKNASLCTAVSFGARHTAVFCAAPCLRSSSRTTQSSTGSLLLRPEPSWRPSPP